MSEKFDEYEKDQKEKEKIINGLQNEASSLKERIDLLENNLTIVTGTGASTTGSLTAERMLQLKNARDQFGFDNMWSTDGRIMYKDSTITKLKLFYGYVVRRIVYGKRKRFAFMIIGGIVKFFVKGKKYV